MPKTTTKPRSSKPAPPTGATYAALQSAYDTFNTELFAGRLPACLITLQRQRGAYGYFSPERFHGAKGAVTDEIALNPQHIARGTKPTLGTLAHEMCHLWQAHHGTPGRRGYHNAEWARQMKAIGLIPTSTGAPGGKETGEKVTHMIARGGPFERVCDRLIKAGLVLVWHDPHGEAERAAKANTRAKFTCPSCALNAWAKPDANLVCGECREDMEAEA